MHKSITTSNYTAKPLSHKKKIRRIPDLLVRFKSGQCQSLVSGWFCISQIPPPQEGGEDGVKSTMPRLAKVLYYRFGYPKISGQINFCFDALSTELMPTILVLVEYNPTTTNGLDIY